MPPRTRRITPACAALAVALTIAASAEAQPRTPVPPPGTSAQAEIERPVIIEILRRHSEDLRDDLTAAEALLEAARKEDTFTRSQLAELSDLVRDARRRGIRLFDSRRPRGFPADREDPGHDPTHSPPATETDGEDPSLSDHDRELILVFLNEHRPRLARTLQRAAKDSPADVARFIDRHGPRVLELAREWRASPALFDARRAIAEADVAALRAAHRVAQLQHHGQQQAHSEAELDDDLDALREAVRRAATLRLERTQLEIQERREQLDQREASLEEQRQRLEEIVESRAAILLESASNAHERPHDPAERRERPGRGPRSRPGERPQR